MPNHSGPTVRPVRAVTIVSGCVLCFSTLLSAQTPPSNNTWPAATQPTPPAASSADTSSSGANATGPRAAFSQGFRPLSPVSEYYPTEGQSTEATASGDMNRAPSPPAGSNPTQTAPSRQPSASHAPAASATPYTAGKTSAQPTASSGELPATAENTAPSQPQEKSSAASLPLSRPGTEDADNKQSKRVGSTSSQLGMTVVALAAVLLLIVVLAKVLKKHTPLAGKSLPDDALDLLGRKMIDQRNAVQFLRIGERILVVGVSVEGLRTLAEITDPVEVDRIAGACRVPAGESAMGKSFRFLLSRQESEPGETAKTSTKPRSSRRKRFSMPSAPAGFSWETPDTTEDSGISENDIAELTRTLQEAREGKA